MEKKKQKENSQLTKQLFTLAIVVNVLALILRIGLKLYTGDSWLSVFDGNLLWTLLPLMLFFDERDEAKKANHQ